MKAGNSSATLDGTPATIGAAGAPGAAGFGGFTAAPAQSGIAQAVYP
jgi:hypothetical protein